ncbi:YihY/virulence factor BrkB family protein [Blastococcus sp. TF02A-30]|uniref:YihY/virulence factor BrkB family protein n=1 Tax=Blastococcus sp. TF02A-30 TaxID=2250580 RepID=UPI000DEB406D|nr:YihY/virulence factor BrkB family protein [Blastococcus sp. TF02A-30]RBY87789.1 YihY/virulence factor BrkB family protein [Blastococcus sp. TF02A-30]
MVQPSDSVADRPSRRPGAGAHDAVSPHHIPLRGWGRIWLRAARHVLGDRLQVLSAGIAFFALLSIAPMLVTALSVYGAVNSSAEALDQLSDITGVLPDDLEPVVADQLATITEASTQVLTLRGLTGLLVALWTATTAATYLVDALTLAYHETETRSFWRRGGLGLAVVVGGALLLGATIAVAGVVSRATADAPPGVRLVERLLAWPALAALAIAALAVLYRFAPDRRPARWRWISGGAVVTAVLWLLATTALFAYVQGLGGYRSTYGSLAGVAISMFWLWLSVFLVIVGAAVNAEAERATSRDSTVGPERPLGERGAVVADSLPPSPAQP